MDDEKSTDSESSSESGNQPLEPQTEPVRLNEGKEGA